MNFLTMFALGFVIGIFGSFNKWSFLKTLGYSLLVGLLVQFLFFNKAQSSEDQSLKSLRASTVHIDIGSGSIVEAPSRRHYLLTNWHVCNAAAWKGYLNATYENGSLVSGRVVKKSPLQDLCAAVVEKNLVALKIAKDSYVNEQVYSRGYPEHILTESAGLLKELVQWEYEYPIEEVGECFKGSQKIYSEQGKLEGCLAQYTNILTTLYARPGSSGSPVVDLDGNLVGVVDSWHMKQDHEAGVVSLKDIKDFFSNL